MRFAIVTGAAGGIGQAIAEAFDAAGYGVIATDRQPAPQGLRCSLYLQADLARTVADEPYATELFNRIRVHVGSGQLAALVNNAAAQILGGVDTLSRADWRHTLEVNLLAPFVWTQALRADLERGRGCVVNVSSIHARLTKKNFVAYATSKAALSGMTRALAVDLGGRIRVNAIEPAAIGTDMLRAGFAGRAAELEALAGHHPLGRIGEPSEVARCALALTDGAMAFLHGACVPLDGGIGACLSDPS
ncbi:MAG: SDR family oxidoreductase [Burkholderiaceae bacterium]